MMTEEQQLEQIIAAAMKGDLQATIAASLTKVLDERDARKAKQDKADMAMAEVGILVGIPLALFVMLFYFYVMVFGWPF